MPFEPAGIAGKGDDRPGGPGGPGINQNPDDIFPYILNVKRSGRMRPRH